MNRFSNVLSAAGLQNIASVEFPSVLLVDV